MVKWAGYKYWRQTGSAVRVKQSEVSLYKKNRLKKHHAGQSEHPNVDLLAGGKWWQYTDFVIGVTHINLMWPNMCSLI